MEDVKKKPFMTYAEQIEKLEKEKGLTIKDPEFALRVLKEHSYFALISGYKKPFKNREGNYKLRTSIEDIYELYMFDDALRTLMLQNILKVEKHVKSLISYSFCETYGEEQEHYLNATNYNYSADNQSEVNELVDRLTKMAADPKNHSYIYHQKKHYKNIPLWVMMKALTLGTVSKMYSLLPQKIQYKVSLEFKYVNESMLIQMLDLLARVRNVCAHNERLFDYKYKKGAISDTYIHQYLKIGQVKEQYKKGKNDLFAVIIVLRYMLSNEEFEELIDSLDHILSNLLKNSEQIQQNQMYKFMGFPINWLEIKGAPKTK